MGISKVSMADKIRKLTAQKLGIKAQSQFATQELSDKLREQEALNQKALQQAYLNRYTRTILGSGLGALTGGGLGYLAGGNGLSAGIGAGAGSILGGSAGYFAPQIAGVFKTNTPKSIERKELKGGPKEEKQKKESTSNRQLFNQIMAETRLYKKSYNQSILNKYYAI